MVKLVDLPAGRQAHWKNKKNDMLTTYAISSLIRNYIYVGFTDSLERRFKQHNTGHEKTTNPYKPFKIIYTKEFVTRTDAREHEIYLKSGIGKEFLKKIRDKNK